MDLAELELFGDVARLGSFAAVARRRDTDPSSVSRAIGALEAELGTRLFHRTTRSMTLTEAGERFARRTAALAPAARSSDREVPDLFASRVATARRTPMQ